MEITSSELNVKIQNGEKVMVDFYGTFCGPCKVLKPLFESAGKQLQEQNSDVQLYTFNIDNDRDFVMGLGLRSVPTIKGFSKGKEVFSEVGLRKQEDILNMAKTLEND